MLATAKADFQVDLARPGLKAIGDIAWSGVSDIESKPRQQMFDQAGLMGAQPVALASAEKRAMRPPRAIIAVRLVAPRAVAGRRVHRRV
jgi:hypothetical protein